jgi:hypothetical protein
MRPDVGMQPQFKKFKKRKPPKTYRYDTSLDPALSWDEGNGSRGLGEWLLARISEEALNGNFPKELPEFSGTQRLVLEDTVSSARNHLLNRKCEDFFLGVLPKA